MNIPKAIEILTILHRDLDINWMDDYKDAIQLGIEALKRTKSNREVYWGAAYVPLPGETDD